MIISNVQITAASL